MIVAFLLVAFTIGGIIYSLRLKENRLKISAGKIKGSYRFAQISDLHGKLFRNNLRKLIEKVADVDAIFLTGDFFDDKGDNKIAWEFLQATKSIKTVSYTHLTLPTTPYV